MEVEGHVGLAGGGSLTWRGFHTPAAQPFRISRRTYTRFPLVQVTLDRDGRQGYGEAPPNRFYGENLETVLAVLPVLAEAVEDPWDWDGWRTRSAAALRGHPSARSAIECALLDWCGKEVGQPLWRLMGLSDLPVPPSSASLGIGDPDVTEQRARELAAAGWSHVKLKLGSGDLATETLALAGVRAALPDVTLTVDANGGWSRWQARQMLPVLADCGVSLVEQPLVAGDETGIAALAEGSAVPVFLDESVTSAEDVRRFADCAHGVNVKVSKLGGPLESLQALRAARAHGLSTMIGCMGESSLGIAPAVHLSSLSDHLDLFGPHALAEDPAHGLTWTGPTVARPTAPGHGVEPRA